METNPYNPLQPVTNPAFFFGREPVFAFFRQHLVDVQRQHAIVLLGRRGLGKSALLWQLVYQLEDRIRPCIVSLGMVETLTEESLLAAIIQAIRHTLDEVEASTLRLPSWPPEADPENGDLAVMHQDQRAWFKDSYLDVALAALRQRSLLLILDDAHLLLTAIERGDVPADWWSYLGDLLATHERLDLVVALDVAVEDRILGIPLLADPVLHIRLNELAVPDAERLIREPIAPYCRYEHGMVEEIIEQTGGHPFLLQSACRLLFRRSEERSHNGLLTVRDLDAVMPAVLDQAGDIYGPLWTILTVNERLTLRAVRDLGEGDPAQPVPFDSIFGWLTDEGYDIGKTQVAAALRALDYNGWIHSTADEYTIPARVIASWLDANATDEALYEPEVLEPAQGSRLIRWAPVISVLVVLGVVGALGAALLTGALDFDDEPESGTGAATATLSLNIEATRQSDFVTQTEAARPTDTPTVTSTSTITPTPSMTSSPTATLTATPSPSATFTSTPTVTETAVMTNTPRPMRTVQPSRTPITVQPAATATPQPTATTAATPTRLPTLDPGG